MKNRTKVILSIIMVVGVVCCTLIPTFALGYGNPSDETNIYKYQALSSINLGSDDVPYTIVLDNRVGNNGVYSQTDTFNNTTYINVSGSSTKKLIVESTLFNEYLCSDVSLSFRNISFVLDRNTINPNLETGFHAINDMYLCFDEYIGANVRCSISFETEGYVLQSDGSYVLEVTSNRYDDVLLAVDNTSGVLINHSYGCRIRVDRMLNTLIATRPEIIDYYTNIDGYHIGGIRNLKVDITSVEGGNNAIYMGLITTARGTWRNGNHSYSFAELPNIVIPSVNSGYDQGYQDGYDRGYDEGFEDGSTYEGDGYQEGYNNGFSVGYEQGKDEGYDLGLDDGISMGYDSGYQEGYGTGYDEGYDVGEHDGFDLGYDTAINWGKQEWYDDGYNDGYTVGFDEGVSFGSEIPNDVGDFLSSTVGSFLSTKLFGDITVGMLLLIPITIPLVVMFLKLFAGG